MTSTPKVARVLGTAGLFPDHLNLAFNERVRNHLRHLPDPAVRPGAMNYLSNAMSVGALPEAGEYTWLAELVPLEPGASRSGSAPIYWGTDGFAFETPGRHTIEVTVEWELEGVAVAVWGKCDVFVTYPTSAEENEVAALLLDRDVGLAVTLGDPTLSGRAAERINQAAELDPEHRANQALERLGLHRR